MSRWTPPIPPVAKMGILAKDDIIIVEKLPEEQGKTITFSDVLMITEGEKTLVGTPYVENASVTAQVIEQSRNKKIIVFKKKRRHNYRRKLGHRQNVVLLKVSDISQKSKKKVISEEKPEVKSDKKKTEVNQSKE